jgi:DNA-binding MarR family transcriptional regulator
MENYSAVNSFTMSRSVVYSGCVSEQSPPAPRPGQPSIGFTLSQLGFATSRGFGRLVGSLGLEPRHFALLRAVSEARGQPQNAVAERLRIPASTMVSLIDHLEERGMLERRAQPGDRRTRLLHLTERGAKVLGEAVRLGAQWEERICAGLSPAERRQLLALLQRVAANIGVAGAELPDHGTGTRPEPLPGGPVRLSR